MPPAAHDSSHITHHSSGTHRSALLLGGTFDPPHFAHLLLAECARQELGAARVVFLPAGDPWRKSHRAVTPAAHRLAMLRLAIRGNPRFTIDEREVHRAGPTYTVDTLRELHAEGHDRLTLILGADAIADLPNWRAPDELLALATIAVAPKPTGLAGSTNSAGTAVAALLQRYPAARLVPLRSMPSTLISSTLIRERVREGLPVRYLLPDAVERYVRSHSLYRGNSRGDDSDAPVEA